MQLVLVAESEEDLILTVDGALVPITHRS